MNPALRASFLLSFLLSSCLVPIQTGSGWQKPGFTPEKGAAIVVGDIPDGSGADGVMKGSGSLVAGNLIQKLTGRGFRVFGGPNSDRAALFADARARNASYVIMGHITRWEDNATEWSGKRDIAGISIEMYDASGELVASSTRTAEGMSHPDKCADWLAQAAMHDLFGAAKPSEEPPC